MTCPDTVRKSDAASRTGSSQRRMDDKPFALGVLWSPSRIVWRVFLEMMLFDEMGKRPRQLIVNLYMELELIDIR